MADSNITKKALAAALRDLMETEPFEKINVAQICEKCGMSRKSFYYHFKDKYDLVNWIFDIEILDLVTALNEQETYGGRMEFLEKICDYFYANRSFYRKALKIEGQNSFSDHIQEAIRPILRGRMDKQFPQENVDEFYVDFFTDACYCAIERWLKDKDCMPPKELVDKIDRMVQRGTVILTQELQAEQERQSKKEERPE